MLGGYRGFDCFSHCADIPVRVLYLMYTCGVCSVIEKSHIEWHPVPHVIIRQPSKNANRKPLTLDANMPSGYQVPRQVPWRGTLKFQSLAESRFQPLVELPLKGTCTRTRCQEAQEEDSQAPDEVWPDIPIHPPIHPLTQVPPATHPFSNLGPRIAFTSDHIIHISLLQRTPLPQWVVVADRSTRRASGSNSSNSSRSSSCNRWQSSRWR